MLDRPLSTHRPRRRTRRGMTLIEVMGLLTVLLVIGVSAVAILSQVTAIGERTENNRSGRAQAVRFADAFRKDVRGASQVTLGGDEGPIEIVTGKVITRYHWEPGTAEIHRQVTAADSTDRFDRFRLPKRCRPRVSLADQYVTFELGNTDQSHPWIVEVKRP